MTVCEQVRDDMKAFLDDELRWMDSRIVRRHLASCSDCRREAEEMQDLQTRLREADPDEFSAALRARILTSLPFKASEPKHGGSFLSRYPNRPKLAWGAASAVLLIAFASWPNIQTAVNTRATPTRDSLAKSALAPSDAARGGTESKLDTAIGTNRSALPQARTAESKSSLHAPAAKSLPYGVASVPSPARQGQGDAVVRSEAKSTEGGGSPGSFGGTIANTTSSGLPAGGGQVPPHPPVLNVNGTPNSRLAVGSARSGGGYDNAKKGTSNQLLADSELVVYVDNYVAGTEAIVGLVTGMGGRPVSSAHLNESTSSEKIISVDVPADKIDQALIALRKQGQLLLGSAGMGAPGASTQMGGRLSPAPTAAKSGQRADSGSAGEIQVTQYQSEPSFAKGSASATPQNSNRSDTRRVTTEREFNQVSASQPGQFGGGGFRSQASQVDKPGGSGGAAGRGSGGPGFQNQIAAERTNQGAMSQDGKNRKSVIPIEQSKGDGDRKPTSQGDVENVRTRSQLHTGSATTPLINRYADGSRLQKGAVIRGTVTDGPREDGLTKVIRDQASTVPYSRLTIRLRLKASSNPSDPSASKRR